MKLQLVLLIIGLLASCNGQKQSTQNKEISTGIADSTIAIAAHDIRDFTFDIMTSKRSFTENFIFSPANTYYNLLPIYYGAAGESQKEMQKIFSLDANDQNLKGIGDAIFPQLNAPKASFHNANGIWLDQRYGFLDDFTDFLQKQLNFELSVLDFTDKNELAIQINTSIAKNTDNEIQDLLTSDMLVNARMVIANALIFKSVWEEQFDASDNYTDVFHSLSNKGNVVFMQKTAPFHYYENELFQFIEMEYAGSDASFYVVLPRKQNTLVKTLSILKKDYKTITQQIKKQKIKLSIPKFDVTVRTDLKTSLNQLQVVEIFTDKADLSKMSGNKELYLGVLMQAIHFKLDEKGSEASAANVSVIKEKSASLVKEMKINQPFFFFVKSHENNMILFAGIIDNPLQP